MPFNLEATLDLIKLLGDKESKTALALSKKVETIENKWQTKLDKFWNDLIKGSLEGETDIDSFEEFLTDMTFNVVREATESTKRMPQVKLGKYPSTPKTLKDWMKSWDLWRKKKVVPKRQKAIAEKVKQDYLKEAQKAVNKYSEAYRNGTSADKAAIVKAVKEEAAAPLARAKNIVATETTRYWNEVRKDTYDQSNDVTHYLAMSIRDNRTSKWCKTRHGLVYPKDHPELKKGPPWHWFCRTEILPLTPLNPRHLKLIEDKSRSRDNNSPEPLPRGWAA